MTGFFIAAMIVIVFVVFIWLLERAMGNDRVAAAGACLIAIVTIALIINLAIKEEAKGPCHEYRTQMMYNAATKTMMPSRVCVLRGEWANNEKEPSHD